MTLLSRILRICTRLIALGTKLLRESGQGSESFLHFTCGTVTDGAHLDMPCNFGPCSFPQEKTVDCLAVPLVSVMFCSVHPIQYPRFPLLECV